MKLAVNLSIVSAVLLQILCGHVTADQSEVAVLEGSSFDETIGDNNVWMVKFYAPWCGHCKKLAPVFDNLAADADMKGVRVGKVDCTVHASTCNRFEVRSYPTLKVLSGGKQYAYKGSRSLAALKGFALGGYKDAESQPIIDQEKFDENRKKQEKQARELAEKISALEKITKVKAMNMLSFDSDVKQDKKVSLVKFYTPTCPHCKKLAPAWHQLSIDLKDRTDLSVGMVDCRVNRRLCGRFDITRFPTILLFHDEKYYIYDGQRDLESITSFATEGWKKAEPRGPIPEGSFFAQIYDELIAWAVKNPTIALIWGLCVFAVTIVLLIKCLDATLADEEHTTEKNPRETKENKASTKKSKKVVKGTDKSQ